VIARRAREVIDFLSQPEIERLDSLARLRARARMTVERQRATGTEGGCVLGSRVAQFSERDEVARTEIAEGFDAWIRGPADGLRRIQAAGGDRSPGGSRGARYRPHGRVPGRLHPGPGEPRHRADGDRPFLDDRPHRILRRHGRRDHRQSSTSIALSVRAAS
jgi:hypothetical protein